LLDAQVRIRRYQQDFPADAAQTGLNSGLIERLNESLAAQQLVAAEYYLSTNELAGARLTLQRLIDAYPRTSAALTARSMLADRGWKVPQPKGQPAPESGPIIIEGPADALPLDQPAPSIPDSGSNEGDQP